MSHDPTPTTPPRRGVSRLRQARLDRGWTQSEVAARIRARCPGQNGARCRLDAGRLDHFETGLRHPSRTHTQILTELYQRDAAQLGLPDWPDPSDQPPTTHQQPPATPPSNAGNNPDPDQTTTPPAGPDHDDTEG